MKKLTFLSSLLVLISCTISAQQMCSTDERHNERMRDANYKQRYDDFNSTVASATIGRRNSRTQASGTVYTIPVVFHVMHKGEPIGAGVNVSDEKINAAMKELNERFRKIPGSIGDGNSVDMEYQFALAVRDPLGNCTNGINRIDMTAYQNYMDYGNSPAGMAEVPLKALSYWDTRYYCNIWIVSYIDSYGGYSTFPNNHGEPWDGIVITYSLIGYTPFPALTHELGHYLGLEHVFHWGSTSVCPPNNDCLNQGDGVCDTPPQLEGASCELTPNPCAPGEYVAATNYMSYSCLQEFTPGQKERSRIAFDYYRTSLLEETGNMAFVPPRLPEPDFIMTAQGSCLTAGSTIRFFDRTSCFPNTFINSPTGMTASYNWTMTNNAGETLTSTDRNPVVTIPARGRYDVTLTITTPQGINTITKQNFVIAEDVLPETLSCGAQTAGASDPSRVDDIGIHEVILNDLHHSSGSSIEDAATGVTDANGYGEFGCNYMATLEPSTEYSVSIRLAEYYDEHIAVYIDFDNNGITNDDLVAFADVPAGSGAYALPPFTTPAFPVFNNKLRMRVTDSDSSEPPPDACGTVSYYGQVHDYAVIFNNIPPVANDDAVTINEDNTVVIGVTANDTDPDGTLLSAGLDLDPSDPFPQAIMVTPEGMWQYVPGNNVKFTPGQDFHGIATLRYTVADNRFTASLPATIQVTVAPVNDAPLFTKGADEIVNEDAGRKTITHWATAIAAGPANEFSQSLAFTITNDNAVLFAEQPSLNTSGDLIYTPAAGMAGYATVTVLLKDNGGTGDGGIDTSAPQTFTIAILPVNDPPILTNVLFSTEEDVAITGNIFHALDNDPEGTALVADRTSVTTPAHGSIIVNSDGSFVFTPSLNFFGSDVVMVSVCDSSSPALCSTKIMQFNISPVNDAPVIVEYTTFTTKGRSISRNFTAGDSDVDGTISYQTTPVSGPDHGVIAINAEGTFTYTPDENYTGTDVIMIETCDDGLPVLCAQKRVTIGIQPAEGVGPIAINDEVNITQGENIVIDLLANDTDEDNDIDPSSVDLDVSVSGIQHTVSLGGQGVGTVNEHGVLSFLTEARFSGMIEMFYTLTDKQHHLSNTAMINITVESLLPLGVIIPNGFTPNGDGINDFFTIEGTDQYQVRLLVYNRWGNMVFEDANYRNTWNGVFNNESGLPDGTYFYTVELSGKDDKRYQGFMELRR